MQALDQLTSSLPIPDVSNLGGSFSDNLETGIAFKELLDNTGIDYSSIVKGKLNDLANIDIDSISKDMGLESLDNLKYYDLEKLKTYSKQSRLIEKGIKTEEEQMKAENPVMRKLVEKLPSNYFTESHVVTTEDGYLLKVFRVVPEGRDTEDQRPAVLL